MYLQSDTIPETPIQSQHANRYTLLHQKERPIPLETTHQKKNRFIDLEETLLAGIQLDEYEYKVLPQIRVGRKAAVEVRTSFHGGGNERSRVDLAHSRILHWKGIDSVNKEMRMG